MCRIGYDSFYPLRVSKSLASDSKRAACSHWQLSHRMGHGRRRPLVPHMQKIPDNVMCLKSHKPQMGKLIANRRSNSIGYGFVEAAHLSKVYIDVKKHKHIAFNDGSPQSP